MALRNKNHVKPDSYGVISKQKARQCAWFFTYSGDIKLIMLFIILNQKISLYKHILNHKNKLTPHGKKTLSLQ